MGEGPRKRSLTGGKPISRSLVGGKSRKRRKKIKQKESTGREGLVLFDCSDMGAARMWLRERGCENVVARTWLRERGCENVVAR